MSFNNYNEYIFPVQKAQDVYDILITAQFYITKYIYYDENLLSSVAVFFSYCNEPDIFNQGSFNVI